MIPEAFRVNEYEELPHKQCDHRDNKQGKGEESPHKNKRGKHHKMIPIEDSAGCTASSIHHQPEWTPDQNANQITDIERDRKNKQTNFSDDAFIIYDANDSKKDAPQQHDAISGFCCRYYIAFECFMVNSFPNRLKSAEKELL